MSINKNKNLHLNIECIILNFHIVFIKLTFNIFKLDNDKRRIVIDILNYHNPKSKFNISILKLSNTNIICDIIISIFKTGKVKFTFYKI